MTNANDPINATTDANCGETGSTGLTKREYFATMAMQGLCTSLNENTSTFPFEDMAKDSVKIADALIKQLNNPQ